MEAFKDSLLSPLDANRSRNNEFCSMINSIEEWTDMWGTRGKVILYVEKVDMGANLALWGYSYSHYLELLFVV